MKAIHLIKNGKASKAFESKDFEKPSAKAGEVLIKVACFGLNYADVLARNGLYGDAPKMPCVLGYEVAGTIEEVGEGVSKELVGKKVAAFTRFGGYSEYVTTISDGIAILDSEDQYKESLALITQGGTAYYCFNIAFNFFKDDVVLVHAAAGGVGSILVQLAKLRGCIVVATVGSDEKKEFVKNLGADYIINYRQKKYWEEIPKLLGKQKLRASFNPIGGKTSKQDMKLIEPSGALILFGGSERSGKNWGMLSTLNFVRKMGVIIPIGLVMSSKSIIGVNMLRIGDHKTSLLKKSLDGITQLYKEGKVKIHIGGDYKTKDIAEAHEFLESRKSMGKIVVEWEG